MAMPTAPLLYYQSWAQLQNNTQLKVALKDDSWDRSGFLSSASRWHSFLSVVKVNSFLSYLHDNQVTVTLVLLSYILIQLPYATLGESEMLTQHIKAYQNQFALLI